MIENKVKIFMERITDKNIIGYEVLATDSITAIQECIAVIDNPKTQNPILVKSKPQIIKKEYYDIFSKEFHLKHKNIIIDQDHTIKVLINGSSVDNKCYMYDKENQKLIIFVIIEETDEIDVEYYIDGVEFEFVSKNYSSYDVKPIINENNVLIGRHNVLV